MELFEGDVKMQKKAILVGALAVAAIGAWYAFRPERLFINQTVNEGFPAPAAAAASADPVEIATGSFHGVAHDAKGKATIFQLPDGKRVLRLSEFETSNGPDLRLFLVAASDATDSDTVKKAGYLSLGSLKGNQGDQNYDLPADADLAKYRAVTVWCNRFSVNFATAPLTSARQPVALAVGSFHGVAHDGKGKATIFRLPDGKRVLRLTEFETSNGPDLRLFLVAAADATDSDTVKKAGYLSLGSLKGNQGDQNYDVPPDVDLAKYRSVTVWCNRFSVNFATAPLVRQ
jgi:hypothetical protein